MVLKLTGHDGNQTPVVDPKNSHFTVETTIMSAKQNSAWNSTSSSAGQDVPLILWNQIVYYKSCNTPPVVPILSHTNQVHSFPPCDLKIHFNIILPFTPRTLELSFLHIFFTRNMYAFIFSPTSVTCHAYLIFLDFYRSNSIWSKNVLALDQMSAEPLITFSHIKSKNWSVNK